MNMKPGLSGPSGEAIRKRAVAGLPAAGRSPMGRYRVLGYRLVFRMIGSISTLLLAAAGMLAPSGEEARIADFLNDYRAAHGLPPIPYSPALARVAHAHARDLEDHNPDSGTDGDGRRCTLHSWSAASGATPVCYTADHARAQLMWSKPREITRGAYGGQGFEIAARYSEGIDADIAFDLWRGSAAHNAVILEQGRWAGTGWRAMGVALDGRYAVVWFGKVPDPAR
ncbi:hypothetical protein BHE75_00591 [Sphingomonas haloaromaticamans]|uniref:SCP domain-containing protein n=2 Tax=Edaphosphingomonas haloaromaticamans TaxID=653954 RepID=A0A1S1H938_9SPHN|nr:hypothetical protein BHE75_00591 [Sphingomonas haloaromaticamans]